MEAVLLLLRPQPTLPQYSPVQIPRPTSKSRALCWLSSQQTRVPYLAPFIVSSSRCLCSVLLASFFYLFHKSFLWLKKPSTAESQELLLQNSLSVNVTPKLHKASVPNSTPRDPVSRRSSIAVLERSASTASLPTKSGQTTPRHSGRTDPTTSPSERPPGRQRSLSFGDGLRRLNILSSSTLCYFIFLLWYSYTAPRQSCRLPKPKITYPLRLLPPDYRFSPFSTCSPYLTPFSLTFTSENQMCPRQAPSSPQRNQKHKGGTVYIQTYLEEAKPMCSQMWTCEVRGTWNKLRSTWRKNLKSSWYYLLSSPPLPSPPSAHHQLRPSGRSQGHRRNQENQRNQKNQKKPKSREKPRVLQRNSTRTPKAANRGERIRREKSRRERIRRGLRRGKRIGSSMLVGLLLFISFIDLISNNLFIDVPLEEIVQRVTNAFVDQYQYILSFLFFSFLFFSFLFFSFSFRDDIVFSFDMLNIFPLSSRIPCTNWSREGEEHESGGDLAAK